MASWKSTGRRVAKSALEVPSRSVILSLIAVLLVCAAPIIVAQQTAEVQNGLTFDFYPENHLSASKLMYKDTSDASQTYSESDLSSIVIADESSYSMLVTEPSDLKQYNQFVIKQSFTKGVNLDKIYIDGLYFTSVIVTFYDGATVLSSQTFTPLTGNTYVDCVIDAFKSQSLQDAEVPSITINFNIWKLKSGYDFAADLTDFTVKYQYFEDDYTGTLIAGTVGILLIVCAICATPIINVFGKKKIGGR